jgi:DUF218 domain
VVGSVGALKPSRSLGHVALALSGVVLCSELAHWWASKRHLPSGGGPADGSLALIVLGYPAKRDGGLHPVQKWRTELAARTAQQLGAERLVFSGAPSDGRPAEADVMAAYAKSLGVPAGNLATETRATSTRENVAFSEPLVDGFPRVAIVSDPLHAARARRYLWERSPRAASRLVSAGEYRFLDHWWLKLFSACYELYMSVAGKR